LELTYHISKKESIHFFAIFQSFIKRGDVMDHFIQEKNGSQANVFSVISCLDIAFSIRGIKITDSQ
jgi:hypothetical protein